MSVMLASVVQTIDGVCTSDRVGFNVTPWNGDLFRRQTEHKEADMRGIHSILIIDFTDQASVPNTYSPQKWTMVAYYNDRRQLADE